MNIGIVTTWFERGAAMVSRAYRDVLTPQHQVYIYARGGERYAQGDPKWDADYVTWGRRTHGFRWTGIHWRDFKRWIESRRLDLILFNEQSDWAPVVFARRETTPMLATYVDYYTSKTVPLFGLYDVLLCNTRRHHSVFQNHPGALYIPWGTDCSLFNGGSDPVDPGAVVFFHSAGWDPIRKGTAAVVEAFHGLQGDCRLVLHTQVPLKNDARTEAICREDSRIQVIEKTVPAPGLFHLGDVYVYPTILEGIGLTVMEALACGLPVITTDCPPMSEFVLEGVNGRLVKPYEYRGRHDGYYWAESYCRAEDVREAMKYYVARRQDLRVLKSAARAYAAEHLDWTKNASDLPRILEEAARKGRRTEDLVAIENEALDVTYLRGWRWMLRAGLRQLGLGRRRWAQSMNFK